MSEQIRLKRVAAGRKGGNRRAAKYTFEELSAMGKKGGRPRLPTYSEIMAGRLSKKR